jgi:hypothetical protein
LFAQQWMVVWTSRLQQLAGYQMHDMTCEHSNNAEVKRVLQMNRNDLVGFPFRAIKISCCFSDADKEDAC